MSLEMAGGAGGESRMISVVGRRVRATDGTLASIVLTLHDATEKRRGEKIKEDFLYLISTAFQGPINALRETVGAGEQSDADGQCKGDSELQPLLEQLVHLSDRLRSYVEVLDGSWKGAGSADLAQVVTQAQARLAAKYANRSPRVELDLDPSASLVGISEDASRMLVDGLLQNAIDFGPQHEPVVKVCTQRSSAAWITVTFEDQLPRSLAEAQQRFLLGLDRKRDDDGIESTQLTIRLALVQEAVHRIGGRIEVCPAADEGMLVTVTLPSAGGSRPTVEPNIRGAATPSGRSGVPVGRQLPGSGGGPQRGRPGEHG